MNVSTKFGVCKWMVTSGMALLAMAIPAAAAERSVSWKSAGPGLAVVAGNPADLKPLTKETQTADAVVGKDASVAMRVGPGEMAIGATLMLEGMNTHKVKKVSITLKRFVINAPKAKGWTAVLVSMRNDQGNTINFNLGNGGGQGFLSENKPAWKSLGYSFDFSLPTTFSVAKADGKLIYSVDGKQLASIDDDAAHPYDTLSVCAMLEKKEDSLVVEFSAPTIEAEKPKN